MGFVGLVMFCTVWLTSYFAESCLWWCQHLIHFIGTHVKELLQPLHLSLNQTAATRRLVQKTHCTHIHSLQMSAVQTQWLQTTHKGKSYLLNKLSPLFVLVSGLVVARGPSQEKIDCKLKGTCNRQSNTMPERRKTNAMTMKPRGSFLGSFVVGAYCPEVFIFLWCLICVLINMILHQEICWH